MLFLLWYDDNSKIPVADKIQAAMAAYVRRFQASPSLVLGQCDRLHGASRYTGPFRAHGPAQHLLGWAGRCRSLDSSRGGRPDACGGVILVLHRCVGFSTSVCPERSNDLSIAYVINM